VSTFREITARAWNECRLLNVTLELTHLCNLDCFYCYNDRLLLNFALTVDEYAKLLRQLADMAVLNLTLTGGEPLLHPDFFTIGARARELGFVVRLKSNGHLIRGEVAQRLVDEVDPYQIDLSLHGATAASHDRQTRHPGSFDRLMKNIDEMRRLGLRLKLSCTLTAWNEHEIEDSFRLADRLELPLFFNPTVSPKDDGDPDPLSISPSLDGISALARVMEKRRAKAAAANPKAAQEKGSKGNGSTVKRHCGAGSSTVTIDQWGNVLPCVQWRRVVGNIRQAPIAEIWSSSSELEAVRTITVEAKKVATGFEGPEEVTIFCPGLAELREGDPLALYPLEPPE
jgi:MoaA/NifB/PqqE/SkfB family radical SAM enzyme